MAELRGRPPTSPGPKPRDPDTRPDSRRCVEARLLTAISAQLSGSCLAVSASSVLVSFGQDAGSGEVGQVRKAGDDRVVGVPRACTRSYAVSLGQRVEGEDAPELLCHTGVAGWSPTVLEPTRAEVTCARCLRKLGGPSTSRQLPLFGDDPNYGSARAVRGTHHARKLHRANVRNPVARGLHVPD